MHVYSPDEIRRWEAWQTATAASARQSDRIMRFVGVAMLAATIVWFTLAL